MRTLRPVLGQGTRWRLVSHLALNHLSLVDHDKGADALRDILRLYDFEDSAETRKMIDGLTGIRGRRVTGRVIERVRQRDATFFCRGQEVTLDFDEDKFTDGSVLLLASVLERFLGLYCSVNSFVRTIARTNKREGVLYEWPPRAGETVLL
jgi:type VI secretion system protein ImpG